MRHKKVWLGLTVLLGLAVGLATSAKHYVSGLNE